MPSFRVERAIAASPEAVFAVASDVEDSPRWQPAITKIQMLTPGPLGAGSRWKETRLAMGKEAELELVVTGWDPPRSYTVESTAFNTLYRTVVAAEPHPQGCLASMTIEILPKSFGASLMAMLTKGAIRKGLADDLECISRAAAQR